MTVAAVLAALIALHWSLLKPARIAMALAAFVFVRDSLLQSSGLFTSDSPRMPAGLGFDHLDPALQLALSCAVQTWNSVRLSAYRALANPPTGLEVVLFTRTLVLSWLNPDNYAGSPGLNIPLLLALQYILSCTDRAAAELESRPGRREIFIGKSSRKPTPRPGIRQEGIAEIVQNTVDTPVASRTSLWAAVATSQESNAWREGTEYFGKELTNAVHAAKRAIDHAHVHPVMYEHYMHFVTFISALDTAIDNVEHLAWQLEHYNSADGLPKGDPASIKRLLSRMLFDPVDVNERVGDAIANLADERGLELIVHSSVQRGKTPEVFLVAGDEDYVRQLLLQMLYPIVASAPEYTRVEINLDLPPPWSAKEDVLSNSDEPRKFHMDVTWQLIYQQEPGKPCPFVVNDYMHKILREMGGELRGPKRVPGAASTQHLVELAFEMETIKYRKDMPESMGLRLAKPVTYRQTDELYRFVKSLRDVRVTLLAPARSTFTANIAQYTENWGMDLTYVATEDMDVIPGILTQLDQNMEEYEPHGRLQVLRNVIIINDDFGMLDVVINHRIEHLLVGTLVIYFTSPTNHARMNEYTEITAEGHGELMPEVYVVTKPAGPRKLLQALKWIMADRPDEPHMEDGKRRSRVGDLVVEGGRSNRVTRSRMKQQSLSSSDPARQPGFLSSGAPQLPVLAPQEQGPFDSAPTKRTGRGVPVPARTTGYSPPQHHSLSSRSAGSTSSSNNSMNDPPRSPTNPDPVGSPSGISPGSVTPGVSKVSPRPNLPHSISAAPSALPPAPKASSVSALLFSRIKVLIAEDNPINQTILRTFLRKRGISATVAANGQEAVQKFQQGVFHIILMDIIMPVMDGIQATASIRTLERERALAIQSTNLTPITTPDVVIVALTASSLPADRDAALKAGCNDYLIKPVSLVWLERKILEWGAMQALIDYDTLLSYVPGPASPGATTPAAASLSNDTLQTPKNTRLKAKMSVSTPNVATKASPKPTDPAATGSVDTKSTENTTSSSSTDPHTTSSSSFDTTTSSSTNSTSTSTSTTNSTASNHIPTTTEAPLQTASLLLPEKPQLSTSPMTRSVASAPGVMQLPPNPFAQMLGGEGDGASLMDEAPSVMGRKEVMRTLLGGMPAVQSPDPVNLPDDPNSLE
ncbi:ssk1 response regulator receiver [Thoreauomyces humboldtii]|nr:ssk1 response regulator receiver [Thoreauomyces humboldtii]